MSGIKAIRANRGINVPLDPEKKDSMTRVIQKGMLALVPESYELPEDSYIDLGKIDLTEKKKKK